MGVVLRIALARLLTGRHRFVLLGELVAGVSPSLGGRVKEWVRELADAVAANVREIIYGAMLAALMVWRPQGPTSPELR